MTKKKGLFKRLPFFVLIFSVYPSLALLSTNIREVEKVVVVRPLLASLLAAAAILLIFRFLLKDWIRASYATSVVLVLFFSYGHIARLIIDRVEPALTTTIQIGLYLLFLGVLGFSLTWIAKASFKGVNWVASINAIALVLVFFPIVQIGSTAFRGNAVDAPLVSTPMPNTTTETNPPVSEGVTTPTSVGTNQYPDVYLIVLDGYSRADTLNVLGYDNSEFLNSLEGMGFYVAECSRSNYRHTLLSMSSTFSMDLLWRAIPNSGPTDDNAAPLYERLIHNPVRSDFEQRGYTTVAFQTGYQWDQWTDADHYLVPPLDTNGRSASAITPFEYIFLKNTAIYPLIESSSLETQRFYKHYDQVNYVLDELPKIANSIPGPRFVYAHIMSPHTPYIFLPDGSMNLDSRFYNTEPGTPSNPALHAEGYINNLRYLNSRVVKVVDEILQNSKTPPVIILMGDHGYIIDERRFNNLMAFHFPNGGNASLYPTITPINTFRLISNLYFGTNLDMRNDASNDADIGHPYIQRRVAPFPETCP